MSLLTVRLGLALALTGCSSRYELTPPPGSPQVTVAIQAPEGASVKAIEAEYLSDHCFPPQRGPLNSYGSEVLKVKPERQGDSDIYQARLDVDGGSICHWRLVYFKVGVKYWRAGKLDLTGTVRQDVTATFHVDRKIDSDEKLSEAERTGKDVLLRPSTTPT
ncbi:hypothetical protein C1X64_20885 [Pseudomonas sp. GW456-E7]|nr:hypothetical protein C1X64_20885 [Pseudomonas sp. GW456-E7]